MSIRTAASVLVVAFAAGTAAAEPIKIGIAADPVTLDPHARTTLNEVAMLRLLYEPLTWVDKNQEAQSVLARSWTRIGALEWQFELRDIAMFNDGKPVTARDVVYSFCRARAQGAGPDSLAPYWSGIETVEVAGDRLINFRTREPDGTLPTSVAAIAVMQAAAGTSVKPRYAAESCEGVGAYPTRADFDSGKLPVGSGTHRFVSRVPGKQLVLDRVEDYWAGMRTRWESLTFEVIPDPAARLAALMTRTVNLVHELPTTSLPKLKFEGSFSYSLAPTSGRLVHVQFNHEKRSRAGEGPNPFADVRVRQALSLALDRPGLVAGLELGMGQAAEQLLPANFDEGVVRWRQLDFYGVAPSTEAGPDPVGAKHLLAQAGYTAGFKTTLAAPDRFKDVAKMVVRQLKDVGIEATLVAASDADKADLRLGDWPSLTGDLSMLFKALAFRHDPKNGQGVDNWGGYANPALEAQVKAALAIEDEAPRRKELRKAEAAALSDAALAPVMFVNESWGQYHGIAFDTRMTQRSIFAQHIVSCVPCHDLNP